jgi:hypothetical protein
MKYYDYFNGTWEFGRWPSVTDFGVIQGRAEQEGTEAGPEYATVACNPEVNITTVFSAFCQHY